MGACGTGWKETPSEKWQASKTLGVWYVQNWRWLFPYLRAVHITLGMWPPIPTPKPGECPRLNETCLTRRERLELGTYPQGQVRERGSPEDIIFSFTCWQGELNCSGWPGRQHQKQIWMFQGAVPQQSTQPLKTVSFPLLEVFNKAWVTIWQGLQWRGFLQDWIGWTRWTLRSLPGLTFDIWNT